MKLKTLKDMPIRAFVPEGKDWVKIEDLKQTAIKWIKDLEKEGGSILIENVLINNMPEINLDDGNMIIQNIIYTREDRNRIAQFLKYLYNITEEGLK